MIKYTHCSHKAEVIKSPCSLCTHCSLYRKVLALKALVGDLKTALKTVVKIVNYIKTGPLRARLFQKLCEEIGGVEK